MEELCAEIQRVLDNEIGPYLRSHGGSARLVDFVDGVVNIELSGACAGCPSADFGTRQMIEERFKELFPEVDRVEIYNPVEQELLDMAWNLLYGKKQED